MHYDDAKAFLERDERKYEQLAQTAEIEDRFYRKYAPCVPFRISEGMPWIFIVINSPDGAQAAQAHTEVSANTARQHSILRLFSEFDGGYIDAMCSEHCAFEWAI